MVGSIVIYLEDAMRPTEDIERMRDEPDWRITARWLTLRNARGHRPPGFLSSGVTDRLHIDGAYDLTVHTTTVRARASLYRE